LPTAHGNRIIGNKENPKHENCRHHSARYASTRFPGKPLALIAGKPLIQRVIVQCQKAKSLAEVIVATDDTRIREVAQKFCRVEMTRPEQSERLGSNRGGRGALQLRRSSQIQGRRAVD